jgi:hypothetical protein
MKNFKEELKRRFEGKLLIYRHFINIDKSINFMFTQDYYTVIDGEVCEIRNNKVTSTGDDITECIKCEVVGEFNLKEKSVEVPKSIEPIFYTFKNGKLVKDK